MRRPGITISQSSDNLSRLVRSIQSYDRGSDLNGRQRLDESLRSDVHGFVGDGDELADLNEEQFDITARRRRYDTKHVFRQSPCVISALLLRQPLLSCFDEFFEGGDRRFVVVVRPKVNAITHPPSVILLT